MKMLSVAVGGLGVLALILAIVERLFGFQIMGVPPTGLIRGATALYLLALLIMVYDRWYCGASSTTPPAKP
ncbi:MAG: hypothetical protein HY736_18845 [Verrucomicrobia bacterium]|nr:hypothetical protein [Verrucomicrobiota bacterium]